MTTKPDSLPGAHPLDLRAHPRLFATPEGVAGLRRPPTLEWLKGVDAWTREKAEEWLVMPAFHNLDKGEFGFTLLRAREMQMRILTLSIRWMQSGDSRYHEAVIAYIRRMQAWDAWSEAIVSYGSDPEQIFDLNHGENAATLAMAYDWLFGILQPDEKALLIEVATTHILKPAMNACRRGGEWWYATAHNNWNAVCCGGLGMLCLALYEESEEARELLPRVEFSLDIFMRAHEENSGGSEEGTAYWNYGMRYALLYLRSHEEATGTRHPLMALPCLPKSLAFPLDFSPHGLDVGFGDIAGFGQPLPFHYDVARSLGCEDVVRRIDARLRDHSHPYPSTNTGTGMNYWDSMEGPTSVWLLLHDGVAAPAPQTERNVARVVPGLDWGVLADSMPYPQLYLSVRGGNAGAAHAHDDLLSFNCSVGKEILITNARAAKYMPTTFTSRRAEIPDINPQFKNTLFINGLGINHGSSTDATEVVSGKNFRGIRMDATSAMTKPENMSTVTFCGRLFLMLNESAFLIVDSIQSRLPSLCESRLHTYARHDLSERGALITGEEESVRISYAANSPAFLATATTAPTTAADPPAAMLRWCPERRRENVVMATLLTPGPEETQIEVLQDGGEVVIRTVIAGEPTVLRLLSDLVLV